MKSRQITHLELASRIKQAVSGSGTVNIACGDGLYVRVFGKVKRNAGWYVRGDDRKFEKLGSVRDLSLSEARRLMMKRSGKEDNKDKKDDGDFSNAFSGVRFVEPAMKWLDTRRNRARFANIRRYVDILSGLYDQDISQITVADARDAILAAGATPYQTHGAIQTLCSIMDLCIEEGLIDHHNFYVLLRSPYFEKHVKGEGYKFLTLNQFTEVFARLISMPRRRLYYYMMLPMLCLRPGECRQLRFSYFNVATRKLEIPGEIMKTGKSRRCFAVPLTDYTIRLLDLISEETTFENQQCLFPKVRSDEPVSPPRLAVPWQETVPEANLHGFRKTARSWMADNGVPLEVAAKCLDHEVKSGADALYQKSDLYEQRIPVMESWNRAVFEHLPDELKKLFEQV